jgi:hypothetical protein
MSGEVLVSKLSTVKAKGQAYNTAALEFNKKLEVLPQSRRPVVLSNLPMRVFDDINELIAPEVALEHVVKAFVFSEEYKAEIIVALQALIEHDVSTPCKPFAPKTREAKTNAVQAIKDVAAQEAKNELESDPARTLFPQPPLHQVPLVSSSSPMQVPFNSLPNTFQPSQIIIIIVRVDQALGVLFLGRVACCSSVSIGVPWR